MSASPNIRMLQTIARALTPLLHEVVFLGGTTVALYLQDSAAPEVRPTDDVDCIVELTSYAGYAGLERRLRELGFVNDTSPKAPVCRWVYEGIKVDVMPTESSVLGFTNPWYADGIQHKVPHTLPDGQRIFILPAPYFIATKIVAFLDRGAGDFRFSSDIEDIIAILDGRTSLQTEVLAAPSDVRRYVSQHFQLFLKAADFAESIEGFLPAAREGRGRQTRLFAIMRDCL